MEEGYWILLDDINLKPQEVDRLMSLLEEIPELKIYEDSPEIIYKRDISEEDKKKNNVKKIHEDFRLFLSTSNENIITAPIKSRCLKIKINNFDNVEDYAILISNYLSDCGLEDNKIKEISIKIANSFKILKKYENENIDEYNYENKNDYLLKNYRLSPVNLVFFSKLLFNTNEITGKNFSEIIKFSIFSGFQKNIIKKKIDLFTYHLINEERIDFTLIKNIKKEHEYYLSNIERNIISYYVKNTGKSYSDINNMVSDKIKDKRSNIDKRIIIENITEDDILKDINRKKLISNFEFFTFGGVEEYKKQINEVDDVIKLFSTNDKIN